MKQKLVLMKLILELERNELEKRYLVHLRCIMWGHLHLQMLRID